MGVVVDMFVDSGEVKGRAQTLKDTCCALSLGSNKPKPMLQVNCLCTSSKIINNNFIIKI